jgi:type II secretory pathway predicted ATPase ExeA
MQASSHPAGDKAVYEEHWGLKRSPFEEGHAPESFVDFEFLALARTKLRYALTQGQAAAAVVGPAGVGKSALAMQFLREREAAGWACSRIVNPLDRSREVFSVVARDLDGQGEGPIEAVRDALRRCDDSGRRACILVEEVHTLRDRELLEGLRMLLNVEIEGRRPLSLLLVGQESAPALLAAASRFDQRLGLILALRPLTEEETKRYILVRLKAAGSARGIFTHTAAAQICRLAGGIPRLINRLCEIALVTGFGFNLDKVDSEVVRMAAEEMGLLRDGIMVTGESPAVDILSTVAAPCFREPEEDTLAMLSDPRPGRPLSPTPAPEVDVLASILP